MDHLDPTAQVDTAARLLLKTCKWHQLIARMTTTTTIKDGIVDQDIITIIMKDRFLQTVDTNLSDLAREDSKSSHNIPRKRTSAR